MKSSRLAFVLFVLALLFYTITLQPSLAWGDGIRLQREAITAESFIFAEMVDVTFAPDPWPFARLGVAAWDHPLYVMLGHVLVQSLPSVEPLWLVNFVSAFSGAGTVALFFYWCVRRLESLPAALFAALALGVSHTFWWHAATPEVYTLFTFLLLATVLLYERYQETGRQRYLNAAAFALGLGAANHLLALLVVGAWGIKRLGTGHWGLGIREWAVNLKSLISNLFFFLLGFSPYLIQFLRLLRTFSVSEVMGPAVGATFLQGSLALTPGLLAQSVVSYLVFLFYQFSPLGVALGLYGWWRGRRRRPKLASQFWRAALALYVVYLGFGLVYQVSDQFAFFLGAHVFWAAAMAMGAAQLIERLAPSKQRWLVAALALNVVLMPVVYAVAPATLRAAGVTETAFGIPQVGNGVRDGLNYYLNPNKRGDQEAYDFGEEVLQQLPPQSLVVAEWYVDTDEYFILRYFIAVEGVRRDVEVAGWPTVDPFQFEAQLAAQRVDEALPQRPVYLASLSDSFYGAANLLQRYCIVREDHLYRVYETPESAGASCLPASAAAE